jgi:hypothetical protein
MTGDVPLDRGEGWIDDERVLVSVGRLLRGFHDAAAQIPCGDAPWSTELADPQGGPLLCHNDVCHSNTVFRDSEAWAIIDWDFAAPGRPAWDLAMTAWYWVPMRPDEAGDGLDRFRRMRLLADAYDLPPDERPGFMDVMEEAVAVCRTFVANRVAAGEPPFVESLARNGGWPRWDRIQAWLSASDARFTGELSGSG